MEHNNEKVMPSKEVFYMQAYKHFCMQAVRGQIVGLYIAMKSKIPNLKISSLLLSKAIIDSMNHYLNECYESLKTRGKDKILDSMFDPIMDGLNNLLRQKIGLCLNHPYCILASMDIVIFKLLMAVVVDDNIDNKCMTASREELRIIIQKILDTVYVYEDIEKIKVIINNKK